MRVVGIHQPQYLPYLGYFHKIAQCDVFVHLDDVQFQKGGVQNRNKIKNITGWNWLTVPVTQNINQNINEVQIINKVNWADKHWRALQTNYGKAPFFKTYSGLFQQIYGKKWNNLADLNIEFAERICDVLDIHTEFVLSSKIETEGTSTERLVSVCQNLNADAYIAGRGGKNYMKLGLFEKEGIEIIWQDFTHPVYQQQFPEVEFIPNLSIIDLLFNCGDKTREFIKKTEL